MDDMFLYDGNQPATKADLYAFRSELRTEIGAVRSELGMEIAAGRSDMNTLRSELYAVKTELKDDIRRLALSLIKTNDRIDDLAQSLREEMRQNMSQILGAIDSFAKKAEAYDQKSFSHGDILQKHESRLGVHEKRIGSIETKH